MKTPEEILKLSYAYSDKVNMSKDMTSLSIADAVTYGYNQCQNDTKQILLDFIKWSNAVDEYGNKLDKIDIDNFLNKQD